MGDEKLNNGFWRLAMIVYVVAVLVFFLFGVVQHHHDKGVRKHPKPTTPNQTGSRLPAGLSFFNFAWTALRSATLQYFYDALLIGRVGLCNSYSFYPTLWRAISIFPVACNADILTPLSRPLFSTLFLKMIRLQVKKS